MYGFFGLAFNFCAVAPSNVTRFIVVDVQLYVLR